MLVKIRAIFFDFIRRLIDHRAPVHDVNQPPRHTTRLMPQRDQPDRNDRSFPQSRRQIT